MSSSEVPPRSPPTDRVYRGPLPERTNATHLSILADRAGRLNVLDWGCGTAAYRVPVRDVLGHHYVGVDVDGADVDVRADVHRLPFRSATFDHVITNAVLEHVADPVAAVCEVERVLRPGGAFSGSVAFLEPHHQRSHFHLTADGVTHLFAVARLKLEALWPQGDWLVYESLATMPGPISGPTRWMLRRLGAFERVVGAWRLHPREMANRRWLRRKSPAERRAELMTITGQVHFLATKG